MSRNNLFAAFFFTVFLFLLYQFYQVFYFFITPLSWGAILALVFFPVHTHLVSLLQGRDSLAAFLLTTTVILVVIVPTIYLTALLTAESVALVKRIQELHDSGELMAFVNRWRETQLGILWQEWVAPRMEGRDINLPGIAMSFGNTVSAFLAAQAGGFAANVLKFVGNFFLTTFVFFFFCRDGEKMIQGFRDLLPMEEKHKTAILGRLHETLFAVVLGTAATSFAQGLLAGLAFWVLGVPFAVLLSCTVAFLSLIPFGPPLVWLGVVGYFGWQEEYVRAAIMFGWGALLISGADNVIRPLIIGNRTQIPTIFLFFGILGGLQAYGFLGVFLGPALIAILVAFLRIYREQYVRA